MFISAPPITAAADYSQHSARRLHLIGVGFPARRLRNRDLLLTPARLIRAAPSSPGGFACELLFLQAPPGNGSYGLGVLPARASRQRIRLVAVERPGLFVLPLVNRQPTPFAGDETAADATFYSGAWVMAIVRFPPRASTGAVVVSMLKMLDDNRVADAEPLQPISHNG